MQFRPPRILKAIAVLVIALAWFAGTNHCSLGAAFEGTDGKGADGNGTSAPICHCAEHGKTSGAQSQGASAMLTCCHSQSERGAYPSQTEGQPYLFGVSASFS